METTGGEWGAGMFMLALLGVIVIFGTAYWLMRSAMRGNKRFRWLQLVDRQERQRRDGRLSGRDGR